MSRDIGILIVRCDRLGDLILSTPVFEVVKKHYPQARVMAMVREPMAPVIRELPELDEVLIYEPEGRHAGLRGLFRLVKEFRRLRLRIVIVLQSQWKIAAAAFLAQVRYRVGPFSKPHSFLFYNRGLRQGRSQVEMHEADYNLQLLRRIGIRVGSRNALTRVSIPKDSAQRARQWLLEKGWDQQAPLCVIHPGMGGSALNWPETHYVQLIQGLLKDGRQVLVTGGRAEGELLGRIREALGAQAKSVLFYGGPEAGAVDFLGGLYSVASIVVAPSTGPVHLAVALKRPVVTFYPPIRVQSALRWGPYLGDESRASVLVPENYCGEDFKCRGALCNYHPCMKSITVAQALEQVSFQLAQSNGINGSLRTD
ncbi:MAG: glycosyltransferase family 9 protein [Oligoflexia bacterium]|nr:glycosyltransferase family 9 protein [Oligoflexia bacterium]